MIIRRWRDAWSEGELDEVSREIAKRENYYLALSNSCFELTQPEAKWRDKQATWVCRLVERLR